MGGKEDLPADDAGRMQGDRAARVLCPHFSEQNRECYFVKTDSLSIELAIYFCSGDYTGCRIFNKMNEK